MIEQRTTPARPRVLIVDDDPNNVELMKAQLRDEGYVIDTARDGEEALQQVTLHRPDLILLDIMIPKKSGFEVCKRVKSTAETSSIPVIMVTALQDMESRVKGIAVGADDFLSRPVDRAELVARVRSMLRIKHLNDELSRESQTSRESTEQLELQQRVLKSMSTQLMQASHLKYEFIVNMSHALRTPLNVIIGFSEMLLDGLVGNLNDRQERYVGNVLHSGRELQGLISNIVDVFKIETGKILLETTEFSLRNAIDSSLRSYAAIIKEKHVDVTIRVEPDIDRVCADPQKLSTVLNNLFSNAFRFVPDHGTVDVTAERAGDWVQVAVKDSGIGLSLEDCKRVFTEFYRVSDPASAASAGSGLGLAISRKLIQMHGGDIWAESVQGGGAKFIFTLPFGGRDGD